MSNSFTVLQTPVASGKYNLLNYDDEPTNCITAFHKNPSTHITSISLQPIPGFKSQLFYLSSSDLAATLPRLVSYSTIFPGDIFLSAQRSVYIDTKVGFTYVQT